MVQEYGRYFNMPDLLPARRLPHRPEPLRRRTAWLSELSDQCNVEGREYKVFGYKGKQVRDNIHSEDVARFMFEFWQGAARGGSLQPRRRQGELLLHSRSLPDGGRRHRQADEVALRGREPHRRPHLLLQRPAQDEGALSRWNITKPLERSFDEIAGSWTQRLAPGNLMKILITGICGFVGSALAEALLERAKASRICGIDNLHRAGIGNQSRALRKLGVHFIHGDIRMRQRFRNPAGCRLGDRRRRESQRAGRRDGQRAAAANCSNTIWASMVNMLEYCKAHQARV